MALNMTHNIIAEYYYKLEPNKYIISENTGWYEYNKNNILIPKGTKAPPSLLNHLSKTLQDIFFNTRNKLRPPHPGAEPEEWEEFKKMQRIYNNSIKSYKNYKKKELIECPVIDGATNTSLGTSVQQ